MGRTRFTLAGFADTPAARGRYGAARLAAGHAAYLVWLGPTRQRLTGVRTSPATVLWLVDGRVADSSYAPACARSCTPVVAPLAVDSAVLVRPADAGALRVGDAVVLAARS